MARLEATATPAVAPPQALRRYLGFTKLSSTALAAIARTVDRNADFRQRVATAVDESQVGRAGWLWLTRPDGWADEVANLEAEEEARRTAARVEREERTSAKRLAATQAALKRAESDAADRRGELAGALGELADERARHAETRDRLVQVEAEVQRLEAERLEAVRNLKDVESRLVERGTQVNAIKARMRALEAEARERAQDAALIPAPPVEAPTAPAATVHPAPIIAEPADTSPPLDIEALSREVTRAADGASALARALSGLAGIIAGDQQVTGGDQRQIAAPAARRSDRREHAPAAEDRRTGLRRQPLDLPGGILDDSTEAAEYLLRSTGAVLVVDGYNVSMAGWRDLGAADQRRRLVTALAELAARTATQVEVVFDGAEVDGAGVPVTARQAVHVRFSAPGVEADDVVIDMVGQLPAAQPVVVASSDNRVREGARRGGANVVHARQLLALVGRTTV